MASTIDSGVLNGLNGGASGANRAGGGSGLTSAQSDELRNNFMTMLVTQLKNQDPMDPMKNEEMTSQLAQINTVSGIEKLNDSLSEITSQIDAGRTLQATALIGQGVMVPGNRVLLDQNDAGDVTTTPMGVELAAPADRVKVTVTNGAGQVVNAYDLGAMDAGVQSFSWDGKTSDGQVAADGAYQFRVEASQGDSPVSVESLNYAMVNSVTPSPDGDVRLDLGAVYGQVGLGDIKQIL
ncbi:MULTISPECIES: flagellar hook assembly protein FlgD [Halomonas]|uniref:Basal-body rod modification protein FlgD n=1 Tax=Halomonas halophila TaxID=29573 RepID=A0ABQ0U9I9_9GAMM|nr:MULTISPECIES: flagellar hook assembly protein FlgD [Halomonas]MDR5889226.1 flagellar hook assembly protein FlgD [Halomonas salina]RAH37131.1 flagellar hook assembly protein FlgD [Halomonas sp. SL1]WJY07218.1 flagellar hook assembly protein FlgD [Halomonas halophila]GEK74398.1 basal-body rod modification protein FlgD [Halomonas halophila]